MFQRWDNRSLASKPDGSIRSTVAPIPVSHGACHDIGVFIGLPHFIDVIDVTNVTNVTNDGTRAHGGNAA